MNWDQFKDSHRYMYLAGTVVASWTVTQDIVVSIFFLIQNTFYQFSNGI